METVVHTGVDGRTLTIDDELVGAVEDVRRREAAVSAWLHGKDAWGRESFVRTRVAGELAEPHVWAQEAGLSPRDFVARCIDLRGPFREGGSRRDLRERARLYQLLSCGRTEVPAMTEGHRALWDTLLRDEPFLIGEQKTSSYRTGYVPFSLLLRPGEPLSPERATTAEEQIAQEVAALLAFVRSDEPSRELRAAGSYFLHGRIHPFFEGNGRVGRTLACLVLGDAYSTATKLAFVGAMQRERNQVGTMISQLTASHGDIQPFALLLLRLLAQAQQELLT